MNSATTTSTETSNGSTSVSKRNGHDVTRTNGNGTTTTSPPKKAGQKYRHVAAVHKKTRPSCLSHDSDAAPSFIGFRNLMVIVLGKPLIMMLCLGSLANSWQWLETCD